MRGQTIYAIAIVFLLILALAAIIVAAQYASAADAMRSQMHAYMATRPPDSVRTTEAAGPIRIVVDRNNNSDTPPATFGQIGYLVASDDDGGRGARLPLYGQPSRTRRGRWHYYTIDGAGIKLPITSSGRDCMDEVGCDEIFDGDMVSVDVYKQGPTWTVRLYKRSLYFLP